MKYSIRKYHKNECITFKSTKNKLGELSNMAPNFPLMINDISIKYSEVLYQSMRFTEYPYIQQKIIESYNPMIAKKISRHYDNYTRSDWDFMRFKVMKFCIELKLFQNYNRFSKVLLSTGNLPIVEYTQNDKVWGAILEGDYYIGTNALGRLLMELREKVKTNSFEFQVPALITNDFKLIGEKITLNSIVSN
ncbi:NADAR family protein [Chryseobacterium daecheongense]|uniref:NADAR family protein n=1 Tax=Chryseobacterium daecheongense TaxID=192389 RepID=A0A3N0W607_9FLAO|nr:NADAR family protein [Chryseobacterium daecheongense]ROH99558.1 NADAR family protein [Chryseobacterium daecheongense]TDX95535.1 hypothetical protein BCF50_1314 [Chryseobacterium daecheongense]